MRSIRFGQLCLFSIATLVAGFSASSVHAETIAMPAPGSALTSAAPLSLEPAVSSVVAQASGTPQEPTAPSRAPIEQPPTPSAPGTTNQQLPADQVEPRPSAPGTTTPGTTPTPTTPGTETTPTTPGTETTPTTPGLETTPTTPGTTPGIETTPTTPTAPAPTETTPTPPATPAPAETTITPGRATRSGSSYIGVGGNIGLGDGDTALGEGSFAVFSKIGLTRTISVRPAVLISDDPTILLPVTLDFSFGEGPTGELSFTAAPFVGIGAAISTGDDSGVDLLLTGGIDVPITSQLTATASVSASVTGNAAVGLLLGIAYNFSGF